MLKRTIKSGQKFTAPSKGKEATWVVTRRIKTEAMNIIYTKVIDGAEQKRKYTAKQFAMLLRRGIIKLQK